MFEIIVLIIGLFIGWSTPEPQMAKTIKTYVINQFNSYKNTQNTP